jgi:ABC-type Fe3+/spermidine/putrescine transport system ATPase subunit
LDEPLSNLDAKLREEMRFEIKELQRRLGITAVYVTHDQAEALALSDRVAVMNEGRVEQVGTPDEIYDQPGSQFVADFIGLSDFVEGTVLSVEAEKAIVAVDELQFVVPASPRMQPREKLLFFIRPNDIDLFPPGYTGGENTFDGVVSKMTYLGDKIDYRIAVGGSLELRVQTDGKVRFEQGESVCLQLPVDRCRAIVRD